MLLAFKRLCAHLPIIVRRPYWKMEIAFRRLLTPRITRKYLDSCNPRILQVASGPAYNHECYQDWLNSDISNAIGWGKRGVYSIYLDLNDDFPLPSNSFDYVFSQQAIEHFSYGQGARMLRECCRILKPGGAMRIETPNIRYFIGNYLSNDKPLGPSLQLAARDMDAPPIHLTALNQIFLLWDHRYVYDIETLAELCRSCGFVNIREVNMGKTDVEPFRAAIAFNPGSDPDPYYIECSFALEMEKPRNTGQHPVSGRRQL